jgi:Tfp pilus assembly protein PilN
MSQTTLAAPVLSDTPRPALSQLATMPRVDLMPPEIAELNDFRRLKTGCAAVVIGAAVVVASLVFQGHHVVNERKKDLANAKATQATVQQSVTALAPVAATYASVADAQLMLAQTLGGEIRWSAKLRDLGLSIPANVWLTSMSISPSTAAPTAAAGTTASTSSTAGTAPTAASNVAVSTITFQGVAQSRDDVAKWLESMTKPNQGYVNAFYSASPEQAIGPKTFVNFTGSVTTTAAAQSGRYTTASGG